ncbi:zinc transporter ZIP9-A isoform X1 [Daktulosphaira vitifoliae]|uniref:zinc transporter ZIP9-A isoform X1 n=1 Tax=Daktulosphaira vitifoliae TaxID=58002 RepID=UPI0021AA10B7|nr:zinc transporter ZIP9-A isoform X1 [Daktulosphaira vitifoliae]
MEGATFLILLSFVMLIASYFAGNLPLVMPMSESKLELVSIFGAGLLVGTALAVIIPEGIHSLYSSVMPHKAAENVTVEVDFNSVNFHSIIGITLVFGFTLMLLIDQLSSKYTKDLESGHHHRSSGSMTATLGLVVHAAADGIALGAAAASTHTEVEMIVFIAIMLHKAPAAFGLVTILLHQGLDRKQIKKHLMVFSMAAPVGAILTFFCIGQEGKETLSSMNATGAAMLFSAGTFLYVATVHVLPELMVKASRDGSDTFNPYQLMCLVLGCLTPLMLSTDHGH